MRALGGNHRTCVALLTAACSTSGQQATPEWVSISAPQAECYSLTYSDAIRNASARLFPVWAALLPGAQSGALIGRPHPSLDEKSWRGISEFAGWKRITGDSLEMMFSGSYEAIGIHVARTGSSLSGRATWVSDAIEPGPKPSMRVEGNRESCPLNLDARGQVQAAAPITRPTPPTRDPYTAGYVTAKELPDGDVPPVDAEGNFIIGPTHTPAYEMLVHEGVPQGAVHTFTMRSADSKIYPGIARDSGTFGTPSSTDPATLVVTTSHPAPYTRTVAVYVPAQYVPGTIAPFIVGADGPDLSLFTALDNLIAAKRVPPMIAISIGNGSGDAQGSERGLEYDTMSGRYAEFVETEVLPLVERRYDVRLTRDPDARATMGGSSGGSAALIMAWYRPDLYHRVLAYSITTINQQWPHSDETPHGAWEFHERLIPNSPVKPIRVWLEVGDRDFLNPNVMRDGMHDWVIASENMARVLAAKGYHYQFVFARNAGHVDRAVKQQTLPAALEWLWKGYVAEGSKSTP